MVRVLIVDDSALMRRAISQMLGSDPGIEIVGIARDGQEGLEKARELAPDLVTLDIEMPRMNGLEALRRIRLEVRPRPAVLMCSSLTTAGSHEALKALRLGAADVVAKDPAVFGREPEEIRRELCAKVRALGGARHTARAVAHAPMSAGGAAEPAGHRVRVEDRGWELIAIGSSTGGPPVLETVVAALPAEIDVPVVIAQHMPAVFTKCLSERLDQACAVRVVHADQDMPLMPGVVHMLVGGRHGRIERVGGGRTGGRLWVRIGDEPAGALYRPSVDELLRSAGQTCGERALGVVLTGMGDDGVRGAGVLKAAGGALVTQKSDTCVIYGMPKAVVEAGLSDAALGPEEIGRVLARARGVSGARAAG